MFFQDLLVGAGALALAFGVADSIRHYFPNYIRLLTAALIMFTVDAVFPQFSIIYQPGVIVGSSVAFGFGVWYLNRQRVIRQDGTRDNG